MPTKPEDQPLVRILDSTPSALNVCICGEHTENTIPIEQLLDTSVLICYVDKETGDIKPWNGGLTEADRVQ